MFQEENEDYAVVESITGPLLYTYNYRDALKDNIVTHYDMNIGFYKHSVTCDSIIEQKQLSNILKVAQQKNKKKILIYNQFVDTKTELKTSTAFFTRLNNNEMLQ